MNAEIGVLSLELPKHGAERTGAGILLLEEIGNVDRLAYPAYNLGRLRRRRESFFARQVKVRIVAEERHIGEDHRNDGGSDDKRRRCQTAGEGQPHRHFQPRRKEQREGYNDAGKPAEVNGVERLQHRLDGGEPHGRNAARQTETRNERTQTRSQAVVRADLREIAARRRPGVRERHRIDQLERGEVVISRLDDEDVLVRLADEQTIFEQRRKDRPDRGIVSRAEPLDDLLFLGEARRGQLAQRRAQIAGARLSERRRRRDAGGEQQRRYL